jgi:hypothetical protein
MVEILKLLILSLERYNNNFELHIFKNFEINISNPNIKFHDYFEPKDKNYDDKWIDLSFNKINIYKYLHDIFNIDFIWIDIDTIITSNIEYINDIESYFIDNGGTSIILEDLVMNNKDYVIEHNKWIQGNFWKLNIKLFNILMDIHSNFKNKNMKFAYDLQSLFTYYFYYILNGNYNELLNNNIYISGRNYKENIINGLCIWSHDGSTHPSLEGLNNLFFDNNKILRSHYYKDKEIHFISFTFFTLSGLIYTDKFKELFIN